MEQKPSVTAFSSHENVGLARFSADVDYTTPESSFDAQLFADKLRNEKLAKMRHKTLHTEGCRAAYFSEDGPTRRLSSSLNAAAPEFVPLVSSPEAVGRPTALAGVVSSSCTPFGWSLNGSTPSMPNGEVFPAAPDDSHSSHFLACPEGCPSTWPTISASANVIVEKCDEFALISTPLVQNGGASAFAYGSKDEYNPPWKQKYERDEMLLIYTALQNNGGISRPRCLSHDFDDGHGIFQPSKWIEVLWQQDKASGRTLVKLSTPPLSSQRSTAPGKLPIKNYIARNLVDVLKNSKI